MQSVLRRSRDIAPIPHISPASVPRHRTHPAHQSRVSPATSHPSRTSVPRHRTHHAHQSRDIAPHRTTSRKLTPHHSSSYSLLLTIMQYISTFFFITSFSTTLHSQLHFILNYTSSHSILLTIMQYILTSFIILTTHHMRDIHIIFLRNSPSNEGSITIIARMSWKPAGGPTHCDMLSHIMTIFISTFTTTLHRILSFSHYDHIHINIHNNTSSHSILLTL